MELLCRSCEDVVCQYILLLPVYCILSVINCAFVQMHIVNKRKDLNIDAALQTPNGLAVLGFFIEVTFSALHYLCSESVVMTHVIWNGLSELNILMWKELSAKKTLWNIKNKEFNV